MPKRKVESNESTEVLEKKKHIPFTSTEFLNSKFKIGDKSATLVVHIEEIHDVKTFRNKVKDVDFRIKKCMLNNNDGSKIQCNMYNDIIDLFETKLKVNDKVLIRNVAVVAAKKYTKGNLPFEINLQTFSTVTSLGEFQWKNSIISSIDFNEIPTKKGFVTLTGYVYNEFALRNQNNDYDHYGSITDTKRKLDVLLLKLKDQTLDFKLGYQIEVTGDLQKNGNSFLLKVKNLDQIKIMNEIPLYLTELLKGSEIFINEDNDNMD